MRVQKWVPNGLWLAQPYRPVPCDIRNWTMERAQKNSAAMLSLSEATLTYEKAKGAPRLSRCTSDRGVYVINKGYNHKSQNKVGQL